MLRLLFITLVLILTGCGVKLDEKHAKAVMQKIFAARQAGDLKEELKYYAENNFNIISFKELEQKLSNLPDKTGQYQSNQHIGIRTQNRNHLDQGAVKYMILAYHVTYSQIRLTESYYFLASSEEPKLVYVTFQR